MALEDKDTIKFKRPIEGDLKSWSDYKVTEKEWQPLHKKCGHKSIVVDKDARTVECGKCGVALDPIQCLINIAYSEQRIDERLEEIRKQDEKEKNAREIKRQKDKESAQRRLRELEEGQWIWIEAGHLGQLGKFAGIVDGVVILKYDDRDEPVAQIPIHDVTLMRKKRV